MLSYCSQYNYARPTKVAARTPALKFTKYVLYGYSKALAFLQTYTSLVFDGSLSYFNVHLFKPPRWWQYTVTRNKCSHFWNSKSVSLEVETAIGIRTLNFGWSLFPSAFYMLTSDNVAQSNVLVFLFPPGGCLEGTEQDIHFISKQTRWPHCVKYMIWCFSLCLGSNNQDCFRIFWQPSLLNIVSDFKAQAYISERNSFSLECIWKSHWGPKSEVSGICSILRFIVVFFLIILDFLGVIAYDHNSTCEHE